MNSQQEIDIFHHVMWSESVKSTLIKYNDLVKSDPQRAKINLFIEIGKLCDNLGVNEYLEIGLLCLQHFHTFSENEVETEFNKLEFSQEITNLFKDAELSLIQPHIYTEMYPGGSWLSELLEQGKLDKLKVYLFDPYYGMLIIKGINKIHHQTLALGAFMKEVSICAEGMAKYLVQNPQLSLTIGLRISKEIFKPLFNDDQLEKLSNDEMPEVIVNSEEEYYELIDEIRSIQHSKAPSVQIWLRGQTFDHLMQDRSKLSKQGVIPYSNVQDSSLVPSLYRNFDKYINEPEKYIKFIQHFGNWCLRSKLLFGPRYVVKRNGIIIKDPSFNIPKGCFCTSSFISAGKVEDESQIMDELGTRFDVKITNSEGEIVDQYIKYQFPALSGYQSNLVLQHYGCPTSALDITSDPDVAAFFATNKLSGSPEHLKVLRHNWSDKKDPKDWPTIFIFGLVEGLHPFINSGKILRGTEALRPIRQSCGLLSGSGNLCRNYGARYICFKIRLSPSVKFTKLKNAAYLFPNQTEDKILKDLYRWEESERKNSEIYYPVYKVT